jgi:hypothetical protein
MNYYKGIMIFFYTAFITFIVYSPVYPGECLQSDKEIYESLLSTYKQAITGTPTGYYGWISQGCWEGNPELDAKLNKLLEAMMRDRRLHPESVAGVVNIYLQIFGPTRIIMDMLDSSEGIARESIIKKLIYTQESDSFNKTGFLKKHIPLESNSVLKQLMLETLAGSKVITLSDYIELCNEHDIMVDENYVLNIKGLAPLEYIFSVKNLIHEKPDYQNKAKLKEYFRYSKHIYNRLSGRLEIVFPEKYLNRMTSADLRLLRNGIFASYGKDFKTDYLQDYFYGSYPYVMKFCREGHCGKKDTVKRKFVISDLTDTDRKNITKIVEIEGFRKKAAYRE